MKKSFRDAVIIVTGGASGIGRELVYQLAEQGATVIIADRNKNGGNEVKRECGDRGLQVSFEHVDMTDEPTVTKMIQSIIATHGRLDSMINNAGEFMGGEFRDSPLEHWHQVITNNIVSVTVGTHVAYQAMVAQGFGSIINVGSAAGLFPVPVMGIYGASKFAITGLSMALRNEAKGLNINVSVVSPTVVDTPLYDTAVYHRVDTKQLFKLRRTAQTPQVAARRIIKGMQKNRAVIHTSFVTKLTWLAYRFMPRVYDYFSRRAIATFRRNYRT